MDELRRSEVTRPGWELEPCTGGIVGCHQSSGDSMMIKNGVDWNRAGAKREPSRHLAPASGTEQAPGRHCLHLQEPSLHRACTGGTRPRLLSSGQIRRIT